MADRKQQSQTREEDRQVHAGVLDAILYLDSPTDYREYLPSAEQPTLFPENVFLVLDKSSGSSVLQTVILALLLVFVILLLLRN